MATQYASTIAREQALDDLTERGLAFYEQRLKSLLEPASLGDVVAIQPETGDYAVAPDSDAAVRALKARNVKGLFFVRRIGPPTSADRRFAARVAAAEAQAK